MSTSLAIAALRAGLIAPHFLQEFRRWGAPIEVPENAPSSPPKTVEEAGSLIEETLQSEGYTIARETDLEALQQYLATQVQGTLHVEFFSDNPTEETQADVEVSYGLTPLGEFILPWKGESIAGELTNGSCYLEGPNLPGVRAYFTNVRELFFGEQKAFMVCTAQVIGTGDDDGASNPS